MLGTKWAVNASGAALDAARYYGYVSRLPPKDAFIPPRDVFIRRRLYQYVAARRHRDARR